MSYLFDQVSELILSQYGNLLKLLQLDPKKFAGLDPTLYDILNSPLVGTQKAATGVPQAAPGGPDEHWQQRVQALAEVGRVPKFQNEQPSLTAVIQRLAALAGEIQANGLRLEYDRVATRHRRVDWSGGNSEEPRTPPTGEPEVAPTERRVYVIKPIWFIALCVVAALIFATTRAPSRTPQAPILESPSAEIDLAFEPAEVLPGRAYDIKYRLVNVSNATLMPYNEPLSHANGTIRKVAPYTEGDHAIYIKGVTSEGRLIASATKLLKVQATKPSITRFSVSSITPTLVNATLLVEWESSGATSSVLIVGDDPDLVQNSGERTIRVFEDTNVQLLLYNKVGALVDRKSIAIDFEMSGSMMRTVDAGDGWITNQVIEVNPNGTFNEIYERNGPDGAGFLREYSGEWMRSHDSDRVYLKLDMDYDVAPSHITHFQLVIDRRTHKIARHLKSDTGVVSIEHFEFPGLDSDQ